MIWSDETIKISIGLTLVENILSISSRIYRHMEKSCKDKKKST